MGLEANHGTHNHPMPGENKVYTKVKEDMEMAIKKIQILKPKDIQKGKGMDYCPTDVCSATANLDQCRKVVCNCDLKQSSSKDPDYCIKTSWSSKTALTVEQVMC